MSHHYPCFLHAEFQSGYQQGIKKITPLQQHKTNIYLHIHQGNVGYEVLEILILLENMTIDSVHRVEKAWITPDLSKQH